MLTPERIMELEQQSYVKGHRPVSTEDCWGDEKITYEPTEHFNMFMFARAIEAEARKHDAMLIQQMLEALERAKKHHFTTSLPLVIENYGSRIKCANEGSIVWCDLVPVAITTARKRLENT